MEPEPQANGTWCVTVDPAWPGFAGHFPGNPLVPAALLVDWGLSILGQPATLLRARFTAPLRPGDQALLTRTGLRIAISCRGLSVATLHFARGAAPPPPR